jgi:hypothetical protein
VRRGDSGDWVAAALNAPLTAEDRISTGPAARAEVQFDAANMIRLGSDTEVRFTELADHRYLMQVAHGTVTFSVVRTSQADVEVDTPTVSLRPSQRGDYRVSVKEDGQTEVTARSGQIEIFTPRGSQTLYAGKTMQVRGTAADPEFQIVASIPLDDWDRWNERRGRAMFTASRIWTLTEAGNMWRRTATAGVPRWRWAGRLTATAAGRGWIGTAGAG